MAPFFKSLFARSLDRQASALARDLVQVSAEARDRFVEMTPGQANHQADLLFTFSIVNMHYVDRFARVLLKDQSADFVNKVWQAVVDLLLAPLRADPMLRSVENATRTTLEDRMAQARAGYWQMPLQRSNKVEPNTLPWAVGESIAAAAGLAGVKETINLGAILAIDCSNRLDFPRRFGADA